jgi:ATP-binding cassette subfamily B (MDR/TAP) protein 1
MKKKSMMDGLAFGASQFSVFGTFALIFWIGIRLMIGGKLGFTDFFVALLAVMFSSFGAGQTGADFSARKRGVEAAGRLFAISDGEVDVEMDPFSTDGSKPSSINGKLSFSHCHFSYPTRNAPIYYKRGDRDGFSLDINAKQTVAFTGKSGCGKVSLIFICVVPDACNSNTFSQCKHCKVYCPPTPLAILPHR